MAAIRVVLSTFRRSHLLPRALDSLRRQTFADWVCDVHNDDPADPAPGAIVAALGDRRVRYHHHAENWGMTRVLNAVFDDGPEPFVSLLEDDNWWEPRLLATLHDVLRAAPEAEMAWSNMRFWQEEADGRWTDDNRTIWPVPPCPGVRRFEWPQPRHALGHLHSNGAALIRRVPGRDYHIPASVVPGTTEAIRERIMNFPILLVEEPLGNFALTRQSSTRTASKMKFYHQQILLAASFFRYVVSGPAFARQLWAEARRPPRTLNVLFLGALLSPGGRRWLRHLQARDWIWLLAWAVRHPVNFYTGLRARQGAPQLAAFLDHRTAAKAALSAPLA